jgi:hypothetical protein
MATGQVTRSVLEGYLDCKYLAQLRLAGRKGVRSDYEDIVMKLRRERHLAIAEALRGRHGEGCIIGLSISRSDLRQGTPFVLGPEIRD